MSTINRIISIVSSPFKFVFDCYYLPIIRNKHLKEFFYILLFCSFLTVGGQYEEIYNEIKKSKVTGVAQGYLDFDDKEKYDGDTILINNEKKSYFNCQTEYHTKKSCLDYTARDAYRGKLVDITYIAYKDHDLILGIKSSQENILDEHKMKDLYTNFINIYFTFSNIIINFSALFICSPIVRFSKAYKVKYIN